MVILSVSAMGSELEQLKSVLRSLVVSSPVQMDMRTLCRDYRSMMGESIPIAKYGYREVFSFLKERCSDCFLFGGSPANPLLTLIVPDQLRHIDNFVQKQKINSNMKFKGKRSSVPESYVKHVRQTGPTSQPQSTLKYKPPVTKHTPSVNEHKPSVTKYKLPETGNKVPVIEYKPSRTESKQTVYRTETNNIRKHQSSIQCCNNLRSTSNLTESKETNSYHETDTVSNQLAVQNFLKKRRPHLTSSVSLQEPSEMVVSRDDDSGRMTSSSGSSSKRTMVEELRSEFKELIAEHPDGLWSTDLLRTYRKRFGRELQFERLGYTSVVSLTRVLSDVVRVERPEPTGDWLLVDARRPRSAALLGPRRHLPAYTLSTAREPINVDDALPGIEFDAAVFPADCVHYVDSVPGASLGDIVSGSKVEVCVGEVYSPSHFWLLRLGDCYNIAMENIMDEMTSYYTSSEGKERTLSPGAVRVGHYCSSVFEGDWHRSLIVKVIDCDTVKVRHIDYGTVERVPVSKLKPLKKCWAELPAQAIRARLAGVRPSCGGRRWPHAAAAHFLQLIENKRLVGDVVAIDPEETIVELYLVDTSGSDDVSVNDELVTAGHADARTDSALQTSEPHLLPTFCAIEDGDTPNYSEICHYLRLGISLQYVPEYTRHVAPRDPPAPLEPLWRRQRRTSVHITLSDDDDDDDDDEEPPSAPPALLNRVPLMCVSSLPVEEPPPVQCNVSYPPHVYFQPQPVYHPQCVYYQPQYTSRLPVLPPLRAPHEHSFLHPVVEDTVGIPRFDCVVYRKLTQVDALVAERHITETVARCEQESAGSDVVRVRRLDVDIFRRLMLVDGETAHRHMLTAIERALAAARPALNPHAAEFRSVTSSVGGEDSLPASVRQFFDAAVSPAPPPGFELD